eukprot:616642-Rhodomonas_salina.1
MAVETVERKKVTVGVRCVGCEFINSLCALHYDVSIEEAEPLLAWFDPENKGALPRAVPDSVGGSIGDSVRDSVGDSVGYCIGNSVAGSVGERVAGSGAPPRLVRPLPNPSPFPLNPICKPKRASLPSMHLSQPGRGALSRALRRVGHVVLRRAGQVGVGHVV